MIMHDKHDSMRVISKKILISHTTFDLVLQNSLTWAAMGPGNLDFGTCSLPMLPWRLTSSSPGRQPASPHCDHRPAPTTSSCSVQTVKQESSSCKGRGKGKTWWEDCSTRTSCNIQAGLSAKEEELLFLLLALDYCLLDCAGRTCLLVTAPTNRSFLQEEQQAK